MTSCFLDTGYLIALEASDDQHHEAALRHWQEDVLARPAIDCYHVIRLR
jgi:predicted nucleic acid-binding protein